MEDVGFGADAVVHLGKHGTLEWLPGKSVGLSAACTPDAALGDLPLLYPFVVNDPGEGTRLDLAKRELADDGVGPGRDGQQSTSHRSVLERSLAIDLKHADGLAVLYRLLAGTDVFVTNFPLPVRERLKIAAAHVLPLNPRLRALIEAGACTIVPPREPVEARHQRVV